MVEPRPSDAVRGARPQGRSGRLAVIAVLLLGLIVALIGSTHPGGRVRGDLVHGPIGVPLPAPPGFEHAYQVRWSLGHTGVTLVVRQAPSCRPRLRRVASTAPGRLEVDIRASLSAQCLTDAVPWSFQLPRPTVIAPRQGVEVFVNGYRLALAARRR